MRPHSRDPPMHELIDARLLIDQIESRRLLNSHMLFFHSLILVFAFHPNKILMLTENRSSSINVAAIPNYSKFRTPGSSKAMSLNPIHPLDLSIDYLIRYGSKRSVFYNKPCLIRRQHHHTTFKHNGKSAPL